MNDYLHVGEVAANLGLSVSTVRRMIDRKEFGDVRRMYWKGGRVRVVNKASLEDWMSKRERVGSRWIVVVNTKTRRYDETTV